MPIEANPAAADNQGCDARSVNGDRSISDWSPFQFYISSSPTSFPQATWLARNCALFLTHPPRASSHPPTPSLPRQASFHGDAPLAHGEGLLYFLSTPSFTNAAWSSPTARIEGAPSACAASASKGGDQAASSLPSARVARAQRVNHEACSPRPRWQGSGRHSVRASVTTYTSPAPALRRALAHSWAVVPVVMTSSISSTRLSMTSAGR